MQILEPLSNGFITSSTLFQDSCCDINFSVLRREGVTSVCFRIDSFIMILQKGSFRAVISQGRQILQREPVASQNVFKRNKVLSIDNINPHVKKMEYAVRGPIVIRAGEIEQEIKKVWLNELLSKNNNNNKKF